MLALRKAELCQSLQFSAAPPVVQQVADTAGIQGEGGFGLMLFERIDG